MIIRVPWILCRADEATAELFQMTYRGREFYLMAYSEKEAHDWWRELPEVEKSSTLGMSAPRDDTPFLF